jgi:hypothetical protein
MPPEQRDEMKSKEVVSEASGKYDWDAEVLEEQAK